MKKFLLIILLINKNVFGCFGCFKSEISQEERERAEKAEWERNHQEYYRAADANGKKLINLLRLGDTKKAHELLIDSKIDVNVFNEDGTTPLMIASYQGYNEIIKMLFRHGAKVLLRNNYDETALTLAIKSCNEQTVKLIKGQITEYALDLIKLGINDEKIKTITDLIENNQVDVNYQNKYGHSLLAYAAEHSSIVLVNLLLKNGADINVKDKDDSTILMAPIFNNNLQMIDLLLINGFNLLNHRDKKSWTPLKWAIFIHGNRNICCNCSLIRLLLEKGARIIASEEENVDLVIFKLMKFKFCEHNPLLQLLHKFKVIDVNSKFYQDYFKLMRST